MINTVVNIYFPKQHKDFKVISRKIRQNVVFKDFVVSKSKDRRDLYLDFETEEVYNTLKPMLLTTLKTLGYDFEEKITA